MGYRNKIALLDKGVHVEIKDMTMDEIKNYWSNKTGEEIDEDGYLYIPIYELSNEIYELGKYCELDYLNEHKKDIFSKKEVEDYFNDGQEFKIIGKEGLLAIIEDYRLKVVKMYQDLINRMEKPEDEKTEDEKVTEMLHPEDSPLSHFKGKLREWDCELGGRKFTPYQLNEKVNSVVSSWKYEYQVFELVRLLKTIDFDKNELVLTGW